MRCDASRETGNPTRPPSQTNPPASAGNIAAATPGWGFFVHTRLAPRGLSKARWPAVRPFRTPLGRFINNAAHSARMCLEMEADGVDGGDSPPVNPDSPPANWQPANPDGSWAETRVEGFTCHHAFVGGFCEWMGLPARGLGVGDPGIGTRAFLLPAGCCWLLAAGCSVAGCGPLAAALLLVESRASAVGLWAQWRHVRARPPPAPAPSPRRAAQGPGWAGCGWWAPPGRTPPRACSLPPRGPT
jgi:hypothetical protein